MLKRKEWWKRLINLQTFFLWCFSGLSFWIAIMENIIFHFSLCPGNQLYTELDSSPFASPLVERKQIKVRLLNVMSSSPFLSLHLIPVNWVNHGFSTLKEENWLYTMRLYLLYSNTFSILSSAHYCNFFFFFFCIKMTHVGSLQETINCIPMAEVLPAIPRRQELVGWPGVLSWPLAYHTT